MKYLQFVLYFAICVIAQLLLKEEFISVESEILRNKYPFVDVLYVLINQLPVKS